MEAVYDDKNDVIVFSVGIKPDFFIDAGNVVLGIANGAVVYAEVTGVREAFGEYFQNPRLVEEKAAEYVESVAEDLGYYFPLGGGTTSV